MTRALKTERQGRTDTLLSKQLAWLDHADLHQLRARWMEVYETSPPQSLRPGMLARAIAYRLQAEVHGDVRLGQALMRTTASEAKPADSAVKLIRSWRGELHEVQAFGDRFIYRDQTWRSLSAIAREITGTRWNGLTFFGVQNRGDLSRAVRRG